MEATANRNPLSHDIEKSPVFFYVLGALKGDGHYDTKRRSISICTTIQDIAMLKRIQQIMRQLSPVTRVTIRRHVWAVGNRKPQYCIRFACKDFFERQYPALLPTTRAEKIYYLQGLFDAEGSIVSTTVRTKKGYLTPFKALSVSQKGVSDLRLWHTWLQELGLAFRTDYREGSRSRLWTCKNSTIKSFQRIINFHIPRKKQKLNKVISFLKQSHLTDEEQRKVQEIYITTHLGIGVIGKIFNRNCSAISRIIKTRGTPIIHKPNNGRWIRSSDLDKSEVLLTKFLPQLNRLEGLRSCRNISTRPAMSKPS